MNIILRVIRVNLPLTEISITRNCKKTRKKKNTQSFIIATPLKMIASNSSPFHHNRLAEHFDNHKDSSIIERRNGS